MAILISGGVTQGSANPSLPFRVPPTPITLAGGQSYILPAGPTMVNGGPYTELQQFDGALGYWRTARLPGGAPYVVDADGANYRLFNTTGMAIGALITNGGTSYTTAPTVTASFGGSAWSAIVGGSINTTVTVTTAGAYSYPPVLVFSDPPAGGVRASAIPVMSGTAISSVTVINAGAGYTTAPTITIVADPRETLAQGGVLTVNATLANSGVVTAVICIDPGTTTATSVPTLTFAGGTTSTVASATALMNFVVNGFTVTTTGSSLGTSLPVLIESLSPFASATVAATSVDPQLDVGMHFNRAARLLGFSNSSGGLIASNTSLTTMDAGWGFQAVPSLIAIPTFLATTGAISPSIVAVVGPINDTVTLQRLAN